jgi:hypothetical protein
VKETPCFARLPWLARRRQQDEQASDVQTAKTRGQTFASLLVLVEDGHGQDEVETAIPPSLQDATWDATEEDGGKEHIGVEDDLHLFFRASRTARPTSATFMPARRA